MDYSMHYNKLVETRKNRVKEEGVYYERHHILPVSMGGTNDESNLVHLTAREHFLAHWLLWKIHRNRETAFAFHSMCTWNNGHRKNFSSIAYSEAKENAAILRSNLMKNNVEERSDKMKIAWSKKTFSEKKLIFEKQTKTKANRNLTERISKQNNLKNKRDKISFSYESGDSINKRKLEIFSSTINFSKQGWIQEVSMLTKIDKRRVTL